MQDAKAEELSVKARLSHIDGPVSKEKRVGWEVRGGWDVCNSSLGK